MTLLDVALGVLAWTGSAAPIYFSGYDRGYEAMPFPGLYDPMTAGDVSPLISAFEATGARRSGCPDVDVFPLQMASADAQDERMYVSQTPAREPRSAAAVRAALDELSWSLFGDAPPYRPFPAGY